ncbi:hypothetical protein V1511DRAFT_503766 [Dipodascopsis uninucleata]
MDNSPNSGLPPSWEIRLSRSHSIPYYFNSETLESSWEPPLGTDTSVLKAYMAANHSFVLPPSVVSATAAANAASQQQKIRCSHLLVKHTGSRRPSSWKEKVITRSMDEARAMLEDFERRIRCGETSLAALAASESDDSSARKGGDLGYFGRGEMQKEFEDAAFALDIGQMSGIVSSASGLHLIERTA